MSSLSWGLCVALPTPNMRGKRIQLAAEHCLGLQTLNLWHKLGPDKAGPCGQEQH